MAERKDNGQFAPGHKGGPGRPKRRTEDQYLDAMIARVTIKDWREIVDAAVVKAKRGDARARTWLSDYLLGPPVQRTQISGPEQGPIRIKMTWADNDETSERL
jgi:hypothetical protein